MTMRPILSEYQAARLLGLTVAHLRALRTLGIGPPYIAVARPGTVRDLAVVAYFEEDLVTWAEARRTEPQAGVGATWRAHASGASA